jgi:hypothetical protein
MLEKEEQNMHQTDKRKRNLCKGKHTNMWKTLNFNPNEKALIILCNNINIKKSIYFESCIQIFFQMSYIL